MLLQAVQYSAQYGQLCDWLTANELSVNVEKTCYMTFPSDKDNETLLSINNQLLIRLHRVAIWVSLLTTNLHGLIT